MGLICVCFELYTSAHLFVCSSTGSNACRVYNGGCSSLCLAIPGGRQCACAEDQILDPADNTSCKGEFKHECFVCACGCVRRKSISHITNFAPLHKVLFLVCWVRLVKLCDCVFLWNCFTKIFEQMQTYGEWSQ